MLESGVNINNKNGESTTVEFTKKEFLKSFDRVSFLNAVQQQSKESGTFFKYSIPITRNIQFEALGLFKHTQNLGMMNFNLNLSSEDSSETKNVATLQFLRLNSGTSNRIVWKMHHRQITSKPLGISGSDFYQMVEKYIQALLEEGATTTSEIWVDVSQVSVIHWLLKNGYQYESKKKFSNNQYFEIRNGHMLPKPGYFLACVNDPTVGDPKDEYILSSKFLKDELFETTWSKHIDSVGENSYKITDVNTLWDLMARGYIPRYSMVKDLAKK